jgi:hypothetical protein
VAQDDLLRKLDATLERNNQALEHNARAFEDLQLVIRESSLRVERALQAFERRMEHQNARIQAGTDAIWRVLDRWGEGPTPAS